MLNKCIIRNTLPLSHIQSIEIMSRTKLSVPVSVVLTFIYHVLLVCYCGVTEHVSFVDCWYIIDILHLSDMEIPIVSINVNCECDRATVEANQNVPSAKLPPVTVTVASNDVDFIIRYVLVFCLLLPYFVFYCAILYCTVFIILYYIYYILYFTVYLFIVAHLQQ